MGGTPDGGRNVHNVGVGPERALSRGGDPDTSYYRRRGHRAFEQQWASDHPAEAQQFVDGGPVPRALAADAGGEVTERQMRAIVSGALQQLGGR